MSLDSVALIMEIEKRLGMRFNDEDMSSIHTIRQMAEAAIKVLGTKDAPDLHRQRVAITVLKVFPSCSEADQFPLPTHDRESDVISHALRAQGLKAPGLGPYSRNRLLGIPLPHGGSLEKPTISDFIDRTVALNHSVIYPSVVSLLSYAVSMIILGITAETAGVPIMRISMDDSFTYDLGID